jgi:hypothetical protein
MNLRRGFFRLWLVLSVLFAVATAFVFFPGREERIPESSGDGRI